MSGLKQVVGYPNYEVDSDGVVWSVRGSDRRSVSQQTDKDGYKKVELWRDGKRACRSVHGIVLTAIVGARPDGHEACHRDGNPGNNRVENLRWGTPASNQRDRLLHGTDSRGSRHGCAKLSESQVIEILSLCDSGVKPKVVAERFGVTRGTIYSIRSGDTWSHVREAGSVLA